MRKLLLCISLLYLVNSVSGQDPQFTQFYANPLYLAPSFAGATQSDRVSTVYRNQWPQMPGVFVTFSAAYDHYFDAFNSGVGVYFMRDVSGSGNMSYMNAGVQYSYDIKINNYWHVRPGLSLYYTQMGIDFALLQWNDQLSTSGLDDGSSSFETQGDPYVGDIDFGTSALVYSEKYWFGFAVDHLLKPNFGLWNNDVPYPIKYTVFGGAQVIKRGHLFNPIDESLSLAFLYKRQFIYNQFDIGVYWYKAPLMLGLWYRGIPIIGADPRGDAMSFLVGYKMDGLRVGYSYDFTISNMVGSTSGAHEIAVIYEFSTTRQKKKRRMIPCPEF